MENYERKNTIKSEVDLKIGSTLTDPSGNTAFVSIIKPDGTYLVSGATASRDGTGEYYYYFNTESTDPLGLYVIEWKGYHTLGGSYGYKPIIQRSVINVVDTENP